MVILMKNRKLEPEPEHLIENPTGDDNNSSLDIQLGDDIESSPSEV